MPGSPLETAAEALRDIPLNFSSSRRSGNGLRNADDVARIVIVAFLGAAAKSATPAIAIRHALKISPGGYQVVGNDTECAESMFAALMEMCH